MGIKVSRELFYDPLICFFLMGLRGFWFNYIIFKVTAVLLIFGIDG